MTSFASSLPWTDRAGRLSALKLVTFLAVLAPACWLAWRALSGDLGPRPVTEALHFTGLWCVRLLLVTMSITPLRRVAGWTKLIGIRRMTGVAAMAYILGHFTLYVVDQKFDLVRVASEIVLRIYLTIGFVALLGFVALGVTSTDGMIKRLGAERWHRLHSLVHPIAILALIHFYMQSKLDISDALIMSGLMLALWICRGVSRHRIALSLPILLAIAAGCGIVTALAEAVYFSIKTGVDPRLVLPANLMFEPVIRPAWWVAGIVAAVSVVAVAAKAIWFTKAAPALRPARSAR